MLLMPEGVNMPKMTKSQAKRALLLIDSKASRLFLQNKGLNTQDYIAIDKIVQRALKRLK